MLTRATHALVVLSMTMTPLGAFAPAQAAVPANNHVRGPAAAHAPIINSAGPNAMPPNRQTESSIPQLLESGFGSYVLIACRPPVEIKGKESTLNLEGQARTYARDFSGGEEMFGGHMLSNAGIGVKGDAFVNGDAVPGDGFEVHIKGQGHVAGITTPATTTFDCGLEQFPAYVEDLRTQQQNGQIPETDQGGSPWDVKKGTSQGSDPKDPWPFRLEAGGSIHLPAGTYWFSSWKQGPESIVHLDGYVQILLTGGMTLSDGAQINPGESPYNLLLAVNPEGPGNTATWGLDGKVLVHGLVYAPTLEAHLSGQSRLEGGLAADEIKVSGSAQAVLWVDTKPPTITYTLSPDANDAGWHNADVTIVYTCTDDESGVASCPAEETIDWEGEAIPVISHAIDQAGNTASISFDVSLDKTAPTIRVLQPIDGTTLSNPTPTLSATFKESLSGINLQQTCISLDSPDSLVFTEGDILSKYSFVYEVQAPLVPGTHRLEVQIVDGAGNSSQVSSTFEILAPTPEPTETPLPPTPEPPPDPADIAPDLNTSVVSNMASMTEFLYRGPNPNQTEVEAGIFEPRRVAILRGKVLDASGQPMAEVTIHIKDHPEYGQTVSRLDGMFDLAVNGGALITLTYTRDGFLELQRQTQVPWRDFVWLPDVVLLQMDPNVTEIELSTLTGAHKVGR